MEIAKAESKHFDGIIALDDGDYVKADESAYRAMLLAARSLVRTQYLDLNDDPNRIVEEFRTRFVDTKLFDDQYAGAKFAQYLFRRHENPPTAPDADWSRRIPDHTQLFNNAAHACAIRANRAIVMLCPM